MSAFDKALWSIGWYQTFVAEGSLTEGQAVVLGTAGRQVKGSDGSNTLPIVGVVYDDAADGAEVVICTPYPVVSARVGTGGVTRGSYVGPVNGELGLVKDFTYNGDGTTETGCLGLALDSGTVGQRVRVLMCGLKANK